MALIAIHPGEYLAEELETLDMSAAEVARKIDVPTNRITQILHGTRSITGNTALRLVISSARPRSFGSIYKASVSCGLPKRRPRNPSKNSRG